MTLMGPRTFSANANHRTFFGELQRSVGASAGIVDHYVDLPESSDGLLRRYLHLLDIVTSSLKILMLSYAVSSLSFRRPHGSRDVPASLCEMERRQFTQAATGAGNEISSWSCHVLSMA